MAARITSSHVMFTSGQVTFTSGQVRSSQVQSGPVRSSQVQSGPVKSPSSPYHACTHLPQVGKPLMPPLLASAPLLCWMPIKHTRANRLLASVLKEQSGSLGRPQEIDEHPVQVTFGHRRPDADGKALNAP